MLGKLEIEVLLASIQAGEGALPSEIYARIEASGGKSPAFGAVYTTLTRMVAKGLLSEKSKLDSAGRTRRAFTPTPAGKHAINDSMNRFRNLGGYALAGG
jgi:DNA-binding PadR family transcriptional regulator